MSMLCTALALFATFLVGSWNLRWFPSGRAEHRAPVPVEERAVEDAAATIKAGLARRQQGEHVVLFFQELRGESACSNLVAAVGGGLAIANVSAFRNFDRRLGWQQNGIVTDLPVVESSFSYWRRSKKVLPPRGYSYALLDAGEDGLVACYCIHLKSNYGAKTAEDRAMNVAKRELSASQLVDVTKKLRLPDGRRVARVLIAGDFNTDPFGGGFADERTVQILLEAGYANCFEGASLEERATYPARGKFPAGTLDMILHRGFSGQAERWLAPEGPPSDHRMVWLRLR